MFAGLKKGRNVIMKTVISEPEAPTSPEPELRSDNYATTLDTLENACKYVINADKADSGQVIDQTLRYLRVVRAEKKRLARLSEGSK